MQSETIVFNGIRFRRYPESKLRSARVYFTPGMADKLNGFGTLHQEIWKSAHGPIPDGFHIHHIDHDPLNNSIDNLTCMSEREHHQHHGRSESQQMRLRSPEWLDHLADLRVLAAGWHSTPEGIEWHKAHGAATWQNRVKRSGTCEQCGDAFASLKPLRFCSNKCKSAWRRDTGMDDETRMCGLCGTEFTVNKYARKNYCSRSCASKVGRSRILP
jgi:hypothetical protein